MVRFFSISPQTLIALILNALRFILCKNKKGGADTKISTPPSSYYLLLRKQR